MSVVVFIRPERLDNIVEVVIITNSFRFILMALQAVLGFGRCCHTMRVHAHVPGLVVNVRDDLICRLKLNFLIPFELLFLVSMLLQILLLLVLAAELKLKLLVLLLHFGHKELSLAYDRTTFFLRTQLI